MSAAQIAAALLSREATAKRELRSHLRVVARKKVDPEDSEGVAESSEELADQFATTVRHTSRGASRDGIEAAGNDAKAAIGGAVLGFLAFTQFRDREADAIARFNQAREDRTRATIADAFAKKVRLHGSFSGAAGSLKSRADTIAASESAMGIGRGYVWTARDIVQAVGARSRLVVLEWCAVLDRRTCSVCSGFDGMTTSVDGDFDGYMPGFVHGRCRCFAFMRHA